MTTQSLKLKLNVPLQGKAAGTIITLDCDDNGTIYNAFWARRLKDAVMDNCVELVKTKKNSKFTEELNERLTT